MFIRNWGWGAIYREGEDGGGGGGADPAGDPPAGDPPPAKDPPAKAAKSAAQPTSLRAQLASSLDDEAIRTDFSKLSEKYTDDKEFVKGVTSMSSEFDKRVPLPGKDAKPEDLDKFYQRLGKPRNSADYKFDFGKGEDDKPVELDDVDKGIFEEYKTFAHEHHLSQAQFETNVKFFREMDGKREEAFKAKIDQAGEQVERELRAEWGADFDANIESAKSAGEAYAETPEGWREFVNLPLAGGMLVGDHPVFLKAMAKIGRISAEEQRVRNLHASGEADGIQEQITAIETEAREKGHSTSEEPYHTKLTALYKKLYPSTAMQGSQGTGFAA